MPDAPIRAIENNLIRSMQFFGRARRDGDVQNQPNLCLVFCGLNYAAFNAAVMTEPVGADGRELTQRIQAAGSYFGKRDVRWTYWICDDYMDQPLRNQARTV